ncbi:ATP-binding protein [Leuconostoc citreum]|uniref:ATP-binding protein n=1 Tax=Leuconostoc citreum TaxID=33964 RepID=UPI00200B2505|nr:ATP-binding protein [Leuconostoc citreum]MCK8605648.1 ATP-binding protein [Leuconostoc citreum]
MGQKVNIKYENPVVQYQDNLLLTTIGDVWAYYQIKPVQLNVANQADKDEYKRSLVSVLERLQKYDDIDMKLLPVNMGLKQRIQGTSADWADDLKDVAQYYLGQETVDILESEFNPVVQDEFFIGVKLKNNNIDDSLKERFQFASDLILKRVAETLRYQVKFDDKFFQRYADMNDDVYSILRPLMATKVTTEKLLYLLGITYGHTHEQGLETMRDTVFDVSKAGYVKRITRDKTDYFTHLVLNMPDNLSGLDLIPELQSFKFPNEVHFKLHYPQRDGFRGIRQKTKGAKARYRDEMRDALDTDDDSSKRSEMNYALSQQLVNVMDEKYAFLEWALVVVVHDDNFDVLKNKVRKIKSDLSNYDNDIDVFQPSFNQELLLYQNLPATTLGIFSRWRQYTTAPAIAEMMFGTSHALGSRTGFYIGRTLDNSVYETLDEAVESSRLVLLINLIIGNKGISGAASDSPHIAITGDTGFGKSFLVKMLLLNIALFKVKLIYIDPKQEVRKWFMQALETETNPYFIKLLKSFHYVTLDASKQDNKGVLDPMLTLNSSSSSDDIPTVLTLIREMLEQIQTVADDITLKSDLNSAIKTVCQQRLAGKKVGTLAIIPILKQGSAKAQELARYYETTIPDSMMRLAFSDGSTDSISFDNARTILEVTGLDLPKAEQEARNYTDTQKYSISIMLALGKYLEQFGRENTKEFSVEFIDEAWIFNTSSAGQKVFNSIKRLGRSENNMLTFATQGVQDINDEHSNGQYGQIFAFSSTDERERENILRHFSLPVTKANLTMVKDLKKGQCLFRDIYGRVGKVVIHSLFDEWTTAFKTVDTNESARLEEKYG